MAQPEHTPEKLTPPAGGSPDGSPAANPLAQSTFKKEVVKGLVLGTFAPPDYGRMEAFARAEGSDVNSAMRTLLLRALTELKPVVPEAIQAVSEVKGVWKTVTINKQPRERFYLHIDLKESHRSLVEAWNVVLPALLDRHQLNLLPITEEKIPICFYGTLPRLPSVLKALMIDVQALPVVREHTLDVIAPAELQSGKAKPAVRLLEPEQMLAFINRSPTFFQVMREPILAARSKYGANFAGIDQSEGSGCVSLHYEQILLIDRLKSSCERLFKKEQQ